MSTLRDTVLFGLDAELASTRRVLEAVPGDKLDWRPHPKSFALGSLAAHIANLVAWQTMILETDDLDLSVPIPRNAPPATTAALLETFDGNAEALRAALATADDAHLGTTWALRHGAHEIAAAPRVQMMRGMGGLSHLIHHRGQLTVYLRLLDVPVPGVYGPSADDGRPG
jgi:uncharacterized damage-inducible protein DinB